MSNQLPVNARGVYFAANPGYVQRAIDELDFVQPSIAWDRQPVLNRCRIVMAIPVPVLVLRITSLDGNGILPCVNLDLGFLESLLVVRALHRVHLYLVLVPHR